MLESSFTFKIRVTRIRNEGEVLYLYQDNEVPNIEAMMDLYESLNWNRIGLTENEFKEMIAGSWYNLFIYDDTRLIATGRVISDGVITGLICGVGVHPDYQGQGIGREIVMRLVEKLQVNGIYPQLMCEETLIPFYEKIGFEKFTVGMNYPIQRGIAELA